MTAATRANPVTRAGDGLALASRLLAIGRVAGRRAEAGGVRFTALLLATLTLALGLGSLVAVHAVYTGKEERRTARTPVASDEALKETSDATAWLVGSDSLDGERRFSVVYLSPLKGDAPLPPGLDHWPAPGEAVLSPALRKAGAGEDIDHRYGPLAGTIGERGLDEPSEWLAYVRPRDGLDAERPHSVVTGFGPAAGRVTSGLEPGTGRLDEKPEWMFQAAVLGMLVLPAVALLVVAARTGAHARDRRTALVAALGGRRRDRALIASGEAGPPALLGTGVGAVAVAAAVLYDVRIPYTDYVLSSTHLRPYGWAAALAPLAALLVVLTAVVLADLAPRRGASGTRPLGASRSTWLPRLAVLCPLMIALAVWGPEFFPPDTPTRTLASWAGIAGTILTLPAAIATVTAKAGNLLARQGRKHDLPGTLIAGRRTSTHPGGTARLVSGVSIALILLMQAIAWQGLFGAQATEARQTLDRIGRSMVTVGARGEVSASAMTAFLTRAEGAEAVLMTLRRDGRDTRMTLDGDCAALTALGLPCPARETRLDALPADPRLRELVRRTPQPDPEVVVRRTDTRTLAERAAPDVPGATLVLVRPDGQSLSVPALKRLSHEVFPRGAAVRAPDEDQLTAGVPNRDQGRWSALFGMIGIAVLATTAGLSAMAEFLRQGRALAPLSVLTGGLRVFRTSAAWSVLAPLALAGSAGTAVATALAAPVSASGESYITGGLILSATGVVLVVSVLLWTWASRVAVRQARKWRPSGD
ncbi:ABC transporter permease [Streptomyces sp. NBC_00572]|uniref:ABC transporter permease n=1 Tax=Streptomyces sp. NBC_00572 TaxID=2903664 RepID=UPI002255EED4|nr:ABC transporter permease [Streptomyces sp. NBC_00572]MCX4981338.1 ABC transporter permease [Streptomyces sp. NBC_00572]